MSLAVSRAITSPFFRPIQYSILGKLGSTGTNLVSTSCDQNIMAASKGFSLGVVKKRFLGKSTFEHKATKSGYKLPNREKNWGKARFLGFLIKVLLSFYRDRGGFCFPKAWKQVHFIWPVEYNNEHKVENKFSDFSSEIFGSLRTSSAVSVGNLPK